MFSEFEFLVNNDTEVLFMFNFFDYSGFVFCLCVVPNICIVDNFAFYIG